MKQIPPYPKKLTLFLVSNGDIHATRSQALYETVWSMGIRPLDERKLKQGA